MVVDDSIERILLAALLGAVMGLEREWSGKAAGFRTMMLVCIGAALFTIVSREMALLDIRDKSDVTRIASNIATGIGFIGAGLIFRGDRSVHGLTTAATVWAAAAIGMAAGIGSYALAAGTTGIVWAVLVVLNKMERVIETMIITRKYIVSYDYQPGGEIMTPENFFGKNGYKVLDSRLEKHEQYITAIWTIRAKSKSHQHIVEKMLASERIRKFSY